MGKRAEQCRILAESTLSYERIRAARMKSCPEDVLLKLACDPSPYVKGTALQNPKTPLSALYEFAETFTYNNSNISIASTILKNPDLPSDLVAKFPTAAAAIHPNFPASAMPQLAETGSDDTKIALASNPRLPETLQQLLARERSSKIRGALARNPSLTETVFQTLLNDRSPIVLRALLTNRKSESYKGEIADKLNQRNFKGYATQAAIAEHTEDEEVLMDIVTDDKKGLWIKYTALRNKSIGEEHLAQACFSSSAQLRRFAAENPKCPEEAKVVATLLN